LPTRALMFVVWCVLQSRFKNPYDIFNARLESILILFILCDA